MSDQLEIPLTLVNQSAAGPIFQARRRIVRLKQHLDRSTQTGVRLKCSFEIQHLTRLLGRLVKNVPINQQLSQIRDIRKYLAGPRVRLPPIRRQSPKTSEEIEVDEYLADCAAQSRRSDMQAIIAAEIKHSVDNMLPMLFVTLTFSEHGMRQYRRETRSDSVAYNPNWYRDNVIRPAEERLGCGVKHFRVLELGEKTGRPHFHVLMFLDGPPKDLTDPNFKRSVPDYDEIKDLDHIWKYGFVNCKPVRYDGDYFTLVKGWKWPVDRKTRLQKVVKPWMAVVGYITKYISKDIVLRKCQKNRSWTRYYRTARSRNLGINRLTLPPTNDLKELLALSKVRLPKQKKTARLARMLSKRKLRKLLAQWSIQQFLDSTPRTSDLRARLLAMIRGIPSQARSSFITESIRQPLSVMSVISDGSIQWLRSLARSLDEVPEIGFAQAA